MSKEIIQQVSHWVHDAESCVTVQRIVQTFDLSFDASLALLKEIPKEGRAYSVTMYSREAVVHDDDNDDNNNKSCEEVLRLVTRKWRDDSKPDDSSSWCALALQSCNDTIQAAYERDRAQFHESMAKIKSEESNSIFAVPEPLQKRFEAFSGKRSAVEAFEDEEDDEEKAIKSATVAAPRVSRKKTTSAKSFFSSSKGPANKTTTSKLRQGSDPVSSKANSKAKEGLPSKGKPSASSFFQPKNSGTLTRPATTMSIKRNNNKKGSSDEEKENVQNKSSSKVGNADDFVGDVDDDEDDEDELSVDDNQEEDESVPTETPPTTGSNVKDDEDTMDEDHSQLEGEHDKKSASRETASKTESGTKRRRKRMVEQTFTDENGYLYTETKAVWEDVPSDEEEKFPVPSRKAGRPQVAKGKKPVKKHTKQGSIKSFFGKK